jgi:hypothetical protein
MVPSSGALKKLLVMQLISPFSTTLNEAHTPMAKRKKPRMPRPRGEFGLTVPEAGGMVGLSINSSYAAAKKGDIPTVRIGSLLIVPKAVWLRKLGIDDADDSAGA